MKFTLDTRNLTDDFFDEARLIGIMAPMKNYQFCWLVNHSLGVDFRVNNELEIPLKRKGRTYFFSIYEYADENTCLKHYLYNNKHEGEFLLPEFKHMDFLWLLKGDYVSDEKITGYIDSLKGLSSIQLVTELSCDKIRHKEHLIF